MIKKKLQISCSITLAMLLIAGLFASGIACAEELLTAEELLAQCRDKYELAYDLFFSGKYDEAKTLFQFAAQNSPDSDLAMKGKERGASCDIRLGNVSGAEQAIEALKKDYSTHDGLCPALSRLSDEYWNIQQYDKVKDLCQYIFRNSSDSNLVFEAWVWLAGCEKELGNDSAIDQAFEVILAEYSAAGSFLDADKLSMFAECYQVCDFYGRSIELYQQMLNSASDKEQQFRAHVGIGKSSALLGNDAKVNDTLGILRADFAEHEKLGWAIFIIGEEYYKKAFPDGYETPNEEQRKAIDKCLAIWKGIIESMPGCDHEAEAYVFSGVCYMKLEQYQKALDYFRKVIQDCPECRQMRASAYSSYGHCLQKMVNIGLVSAEVVDTQIEESYKVVLEEYPDYKYRSTICNMLGEFYLDKQWWQDAINHYSSLLGGEDIPQALALYHLGRCYEEIGDIPNAIKSYTDFLELEISSSSRDRITERLEALSN